MVLSVAFKLLCPSHALVAPVLFVNLTEEIGVVVIAAVILKLPTVSNPLAVEIALFAETGVTEAFPATNHANVEIHKI